MAKRKATIHVLDHPLLHHRLTEARDRQTRSARFRELLYLMGQMFAYEVTRDLPIQPVRIDTPLEGFTGTRLAVPVTLVPILRAGLALAEGMLRVIPEAQVGHIGMFRNEQSLSPVSYYDKLPVGISGGPAFLVDPMLATGGSALAAIDLLKSKGCRDIRFVCVLASPEGVQRLQSEHPTTPIYTAAIDRELDDRGYILPGLGDAGDRMFGTSE